MMTTSSQQHAISYNKDQLLNFYRVLCPEIQEPPENIKQFPLILSSKLLQPMNETNLHLFDTDYVSRNSKDR